MDFEKYNKIIIYSLLGVAVFVLILTIYFYIVSGVFSIWLGALIITSSIFGILYRSRTDKLYLNIGLLFLGIWMTFTPAVFEIANIEVNIIVSIAFISFGILIIIMSIFELN